MILIQVIILLHHRKKMSFEIVIQHNLQMLTLLTREDVISIVLFPFIILYCATYLENSRRAY